MMKTELVMNSEIKQSKNVEIIVIGFVEQYIPSSEILIEKVPDVMQCSDCWKKVKT